MTRAGQAIQVIKSELLSELLRELLSEPKMFLGGGRSIARCRQMSPDVARCRQMSPDVARHLVPCGAFRCFDAETTQRMQKAAGGGAGTEIFTGQKVSTCHTLAPNN